MKFPLLILSGILVADIALADVNYSIAVGQTKRDTGQNSAPQAGQPSSPSAPQPPPMDPALAATLQNIASLRADFDAVVAAADAPAAMDQRISLLNHLSAAAQGGKASSANVRKLAGDLINALAGRKNFAAQTQKLARAVHALFNGAHLSAAQQATLLVDVRKNFAAAEISDDATGKVIDDLKAVAAETR